MQCRHKPCRCVNHPDPVKKHFIPLSLETYRPFLKWKAIGESMGVKYAGVLHVAASPDRVNDLEDLMKAASEFKQPASYVSPARRIRCRLG